MLIELLTYSVGVGSTLGFLMFKGRKKKDASLPKKQDDPHSVPWLYVDYKVDKKRYYGFKCPKCHHLNKWTQQMPLCECFDFPREHFHYECDGCRFKTIMRTADD